MTDTMRDYGEFEAAEPLRLPIGGKTYEVHPVPADVGVRLTELLTILGQIEAGAVIDPAEMGDWAHISEPELYTMTLGETRQQMIADRVPHDAVRLAGATAFVWFAKGREAAAVMWNSGGEPVSLPANRAARRAAKKPAAKKAAARKKGPAKKAVDGRRGEPGHTPGRRPTHPGTGGR